MILVSNIGADPGKNTVSDIGKKISDIEPIPVLVYNISKNWIFTNLICSRALSNAFENFNPITLQ